MDAYQRLEEVFTKLSHLEGAIASLHWDFATVMPPGGAEARGEQLATLQSLHHEQLTSPQVADWITEAQSGLVRLTDWQRANLRRISHQHRHATALESRLVEAFSKAGSECNILWRETRKRNDFASYAPAQQKVLELTREVAQAKSAAFGLSPYEAMLDSYDSGRTTAEIDAVFSDLEIFLPDFLQNVLEQQSKTPPPLPLPAPFPAEEQKAIGKLLMQAIGFDFTRGRLDESAHPFCGGTSEDVRITSRYDEEDFTTGLMGILHETGHALYEQQLPAAWRTQPVGKVDSMTLHESQSLLLEMQVCRGGDFLTFAAPLIMSVFHRSGEEWQADNLRKIYTRVEPGLIRVDADEITYPLHIILRYRLEKALLVGDMEITDLPAAWKDGMKKLLNVDVPDDARGCMQDIHWTDGSFGYFPTYTLGAMFAAQFFDAAKKAMPELTASIRQGNFQPLTHWLKEHIHSKASFLTPNALLAEVTGSALDSRIYKNHLKHRYMS